jgi:endonuclease/exonuclease/phosphatase family metal-dependent hydrolase
VTRLIGPVDAPGLHVMSYNIRRRMSHLTKRSPDLWSGRRHLMGTLLRDERPAVLGTQEAMPDQARFLLERLGGDYRRIGRGRGPRGGGEGCPVFFDGTRLRLEEWSQSALSATPAVRGSRSWGNLVPRIVVSAVFTDLATGIRFRVLNTHFDHLSARSRRESALMVGAMAAASAVPAIVMGDANTGVDSPPFRALVGSGRLLDAWAVASERLTPEWKTYSAYRAPRLGRRIDWMAVTPGIEVAAIGINALRVDGAAASDHEPVQALVRMPAAGGITGILPA